MSIIEVDTIDVAPQFISKCYLRVTQQMINCRVRIVSRNNLQEANVGPHFKDFPWDRYEREAKYYYESIGYTVIRLEHFASCAVSENERMFPKAKVLGGLLRKYLSNEDYTKYIYKKQSIKEAIALNGIDPKDYSISLYPPDFLVVENSSNKWKFVEVKGPTDKLRFRQANWFINLMPEAWDYEIFASLNRTFDDTYVCKASARRSGERFMDEYAKELESVKEYNEMFKN